MISADFRADQQPDAVCCDHCDLHVPLQVHAEHQREASFRAGRRLRRWFHVGHGRHDLWRLRCHFLDSQAIYASFAIAITALIWLYLNWLILLIGSQLAFYFQNPAYMRIGRREPRLSNAMRERLALNIMLIVGTRFVTHQSQSTCAR